MSRVPRRVRLYLKHTFAAAHYLPDYDGPCSKMHGHTWLAEVWMEGAVDTDTGMLVDFRIVKEIIDELDHTTLNESLPSCVQPPTAENIAHYLVAVIPACVQVRVWESEDAYAEVTRSTPYRICRDVGAEEDHKHRMLSPEVRDELLQWSWAEGIAEEPQEVDAEGVIGRVISRRFGK